MDINIAFVEFDMTNDAEGRGERRLIRARAELSRVELIDRNGSMARRLEARNHKTSC